MSTSLISKVIIQKSRNICRSYWKFNQFIIIKNAFLILLSLLFRVAIFKRIDSYGFCPQNNLIFGGVKILKYWFNGLKYKFGYFLEYLTTSAITFSPCSRAPLICQNPRTERNRNRIFRRFLKLRFPHNKQLLLQLPQLLINPFLNLIKLRCFSLIQFHQAHISFIIILLVRQTRVILSLLNPYLFLSFLLLQIEEEPGEAMWW